MKLFLLVLVLLSCSGASRGNRPPQVLSAEASAATGSRYAVTIRVTDPAGFRKVKNMVGGILAWSDRVDPRVPKY